MSSLNKSYDFTLSLPDGTLKYNKFTLTNVDKNVFDIYLTTLHGKSTVLSSDELSEYKVTILVVKPKTKEYVEVDGVIDGDNDRLLFKLGDKFNNQVGDYVGEFRIEHLASEEILLSTSFSYKVRYSVVGELNGELESSPEFIILTDRIAECDNIINYFRTNEFVTKKYIDEELNKLEINIDLSEYAKKTDIPTDYLTSIPSEYITETELNQAIADVDVTDQLGDYAKKSDLPHYEEELIYSIEGTEYQKIYDIPYMNINAIEIDPNKRYVAREVDGGSWTWEMYYHEEMDALYDEPHYDDEDFFQEGSYLILNHRRYDELTHTFIVDENSAVISFEPDYFDDPYEYTPDDSYDDSGYLKIYAYEKVVLDSGALEDDVYIINSLAVGEQAEATGTNSVALGYNTKATHISASAIGHNASATSYYAHAEGSNTVASGESSHAEGNWTTASGRNAHTEGYDSVASGNNAHAEGYDTLASGYVSHAEGGSTSAEGDYSHTEGWNTYAKGDFSHAEGYGAIAGSDYQHAQGKYNIEDTTNKYAFIIGNGEGSSKRSNALTVDWNGNVWFAGNLTVGTNKYTVAPTVSPVFENSISMGRKTNSTVGVKSFAVGNDVTASGSYSFAHGSYAEATGNMSYSGGYFTKSSGTGSHAEGSSCTATGLGSHAEGQGTLADAHSSHAEGNQTIASASSSHAEGYYTLASSQYQHVQGRFNIEDKGDVYAHIVGNGMDDIRSNAHTLDWEGNAWFSGDVYIGGTSQANGEKLATESHVATTVPTKTSQLTNDSGYLTSVPSEYVTDSELNAKGFVEKDEVSLTELSNTPPTDDNVVIWLNPNAEEEEIELDGYISKSELANELNKLKAELIEMFYNGDFGGGSGGDTTVPTYHTEEISRVVQNIWKLKSEHPNSIVFGTISDNHVDLTNQDVINSATYGAYAMGRVGELAQADFIANLGDNIVGTNIDSDTEYANFKYMEEVTQYNTSVPFFNLVGNHCKSSSTQKIYDVIGTYNDFDVYSTTKIRGFGYKDFTNKKVRVITLNTCDYWNIQGGNGMSYEQKDFFMKALDLSAKSDYANWTIVVLSHIPLDFLGGDYNKGADLKAILKAYNDGTTATITIDSSNASRQNESSKYSGTLTYNYSGKNTPKLINIHGHVHTNCYGKLKFIDDNTTLNMHRMATPNSNFNQNASTDRYTSSGDYSITKEEANKILKYRDCAKDTSATFYVIDLDGKVIYSVGYGADIDRQLIYGDAKKFNVTYSLIDVSSSNNANEVIENNKYTTTLSVADSNFVIDNVKVTMGGTDITSTCYSNGVITITSVTGDISITASAKDNYVAVWDLGSRTGITNVYEDKTKAHACVCSRKNWIAGIGGTGIIDYRVISNIIVDGNDITFTSTTKGYNIGLPYQLEPNASYTITATCTASDGVTPQEGRIRVVTFDSTGLLTSYTGYDSGGSTNPSVTITAHSDPTYWTVIMLDPRNNGATIKFSNVTLTKN